MSANTGDVRGEPAGAGPALPPICFLSSARYPRPLDATQAKKWAMLASLGRLFVIGFSTGRRPGLLAEPVRFYLLPQLPGAPLRYALFLGAGAALTLWLVAGREVRIIVAQGPYEAFAGALAKRVAGLFGARVALVVESHGEFETSVFHHRRVRLAVVYRAIMPRVARWTFGQADVLRAVSASIRHQLETWAPGRPVVTFPTWTDIDVFVAAGQARQRRGSEVLYAGVLVPGKGVLELLEAFGRLAPAFPEARLRLIGRESHREYARRLRAHVRSAGLEDRVVFVDALPQAELAGFMATAAVLVLPSHSEGLGRVVLEAMATGAPVVATRVGGLLEVVEDGVTGFLVPAGDVAALAERLAWILRHREAAGHMGRRAAAVVRARVSAASYVSAYAGLLATARAVVTQPEAADWIRPARGHRRRQGKRA
jgi:glycosyltransferase involved in cell wall biosynthesis